MSVKQWRKGAGLSGVKSIIKNDFGSAVAVKYACFIKKLSTPV